MAREKDPAAKLIAEFCAQYPDMPGLTLAKMIYRGKNKKMFASVKAVCHRIGYARGKRSGGNKTKGVFKTPKPMAHSTTSSTVPYEYRVPKSLADEYSDVEIHGAQRILRLSDIHYPFHDERALDAAINYGIKNDPTILLLAGDILDCHDLSVYEKDPRKRYTEIELQMIGDEFSQFRKAFPKARIVFQYGNHCDRLERYLIRKAPELFGLPGLDIPGLISMVNGADSIRGIEWVKDHRIIRTGHLNHVHGHEFRGGGGVNPARWLYLKTGMNTIMGHCHRTSEHSQPNIRGEQIACWSTGCLSELTPPYMRRNFWNHGLAYVEVESSGDFRVKNIRILDGRIV